MVLQRGLRFTGIVDVVSDYSIWFQFLEVLLYRSGGGFCSFWRDFWVEGERLSDNFPRIEAAAARVSGGRVFDFLSIDRSGWCIPLRFDLRGGARLEFQRLLARLERLPDTHLTEGPDAVVWLDGRDQLFSVSSFRRLLYEDRSTEMPSFPVSTIWVLQAATKVAKKVIIHGVLWHLWLERNERTFKDSRRSVQQVFVRIWLAIARWMYAFGRFDEAKQREWIGAVFDNG
ncbi:hypothetical protein LINPERHAP1_LOCUS19467 [Linum perenne]